MIRTAGILMIIGSSGFLGSYIYRTLKNRCEFLKDMLSAIDILQAEIVFRRADLLQAVRAAATRTKGDAALFWNIVGDRINDKKTTEKAFKDAFYAVKNKGITGEDIEIINTLSAILGKYDSFEQAQMMKNVKELMNIQWLESNRELKEKGKLYRAMGLSLGLVIALVMV